MNLQNLNNFASAGKIKKESFTLDSLIKRFEFASKRISTSEKLLKNNNYDDEEVYITAYSELYSSFRILCEIMLALYGYRIAGGKGHHEAAISTIRLTLEDDKMDPVYLRLIKIGRKRSGMEYGSKFDISSIEIEQMLNDVKLILKKVGSEIETKKDSKDFK
ncbi:MAG: hypothetical protein ABIG10_00190 [bacterium]